MNPTEQALDPAQEVRRAIAALLPVHKGFDDAATLDSLGFDSLDPVELALDLEEALGIDVDVDEFPRGCTVADVIELAEFKVASKVIPIAPGGLERLANRDSEGAA